MHYCTGSGPAFFSGTEFASLADRYGFIVVYPSVTRTPRLLRRLDTRALTHNGNSDPAGIVSMVATSQQHRTPTRTGSSSPASPPAR